MRRLTAEITWLVCLLMYLYVPPSFPISLPPNCQEAIHIEKKKIFHEKFRHVKLDCHLVCHQFLARRISLSFPLCISSSISSLSLSMLLSVTRFLASWVCFLRAPTCRILAPEILTLNWSCWIDLAWKMRQMKQMLKMNPRSQNLN